MAITAKQIRWNHGYYTTVEVADIIGCCYATFRSWRDCGKIPEPRGHFSPARRYYTKEDVRKIFVEFGRIEKPLWPK